MKEDKFLRKCLYLPVAPGDAKKREIECENSGCDKPKYQYWQENDGVPEEPGTCYMCASEITKFGETEDARKGPNVSDNFEGPTIGNWKDEENLYTWQEVKKSSWNRWGIVEWAGEERLLILDFDFYKFENGERKEKIINALNDMETRVHTSQRGGGHAFFLVDPEKLDNGSLPISFADNIDDKLNGYVLSPTCDGYEVEISDRPKTIDPRELPDCIKKSEVPETPGDQGEIEYPAELDEKLYCYKKLTEAPGEVPEGERRYACMILAGHFRDEGIPKTMAELYLKNFWKQLKQPPEASSKRSWSDVKRILNDYYDKSKDYRVGCKTVNRHLPEYCNREKCPIGDRLNTEGSERKSDEMEGSREVWKKVDLKKLGKVSVGFSDLYQRSNATRGALHFWFNDEHQFEEDRKLSNQNFKQFINDISEIYDLEDGEETRLFKSFTKLKEKAREEGRRRPRA